MVTFLPETWKENLFFVVPTKNAGDDLFFVSQKIRKRHFASILGFHNDEVGCQCFQAFATNLAFGLLDGDTPAFFVCTPKGVDGSRWTTFGLIIKKTV